MHVASTSSTRKASCDCLTYVRSMKGSLVISFVSFVPGGIADGCREEERFELRRLEAIRVLLSLGASETLAQDRLVKNAITRTIEDKKSSKNRPVVDSRKRIIVVSVELEKVEV